MTTAERPIIMSADSVRAILDRRKTQTRRVVKPQPENVGDEWLTWPKTPYSIGSRLWVRETWRSFCPIEDCRWWVRYKADMSLRETTCGWDEGDDYNDPVSAGCDHEASGWRSPIYMPRWASRITLEVVGVRAERLQDITYDDILAEGWDPGTSEPFSGGTAGDDARLWFESRWRALRPDSSPYCYDLNPWVWVVEFRRDA